MHGRISQAIAVIMTGALLITGCTSQAYNIGMAKDKENNIVDTGFSVSTVGSYDSADTAVVMAVDQVNSCVVFMNMDTGRQYTLYYDGTTYVTDKYDGPMTISQIKVGDVVDVNFLKGKRQIASIKQSPSAWVYENIDNYDLGGINKTASIGSSTYSLPDEAVILSEGRRVEVMDVVPQDLVTIRGVDRQIYSVNVERGHGYLRLKNEQALIGGWIEVGNTVIRQIAEDMLLVVPEGSYQVALSNGGISSTKDIVIERDRETVLDVGDIEIIQDKTGKILFSVTPAGARVTIDGKDTDISSAVELSYGIHQIHLEADGYDSLTKYIQVGSEYAKISFVLDEKKEDDSSVSENTLEQPVENTNVPELEYAPVKDPVTSVSENTISPTNSNRVYIDSPKDVEVHVDGYYIGVAPISFKKNTGKHTVTLSKTGYKTKSYTIYLYNDGEDITYSFTDLEKEEEESVSDNNLSSSSTSTQNPSSHEHNYTEEITKEPTCTEKGVKTYMCDCGNKKEEEIPAKGHKYENGICIVCGEPEPEQEHEHKYENGICIVCGEPEPGQEHEHKYENGICIVCGEPEPGQEHEHKYENGICIVCGEPEPGQEHEHKYENGICIVCGEPEPGQEHEHKYENGICIVCGEPEPGQEHEHKYENGICIVCGEPEPGQEHEHKYENGICIVCKEPEP